MNEPQIMCLCRVMDHIPDADATDYARIHLSELATDSEAWVTVYECPTTGIRWIGDYPHSEMQGGGPMRLRTFTSVSRSVWTQLFYVRVLMDGDVDAVAEASDLRLRLESRYPGTDPIGRG
jgi:hypothetical protein